MAPANHESDSARRLAGIVESAMDALITIDEANRIVLFNPAAERMFGVVASDAIGRPVADFIPERFRSRHDGHIRRFRQTGVTDRRMGSLGAVSGLRANGEEFPVEASISQVEVGGVRLATVILRDITERKATEDALLDSRRRMEGIVESAMDAIITVDEQQRVILFNPAAERMFEMSAEEALGRPVTDFIPERYRASHHEHINRFRNTGVTNRRMGALGAVSGLRKGGEEFPVEASISQVEVGGERLSTVILRDITERKLSEEARLLLAREVDHRAKNALAVAQSLLKLTKADSKEDYVAAVQGRMSALVRAHALLSQASWQGADLAQTIGDELEAYTRSGQAQLSGPTTILGANAVQPISLVFHELATNAVKHGALRAPTGSVQLRWRVVAGGNLLFEWEEFGGPPVSPPTRSGFGSMLLREVVTKQLDGKLELDWRSEGLRAVVRIGPSLFRIETRPAPGFAPRLPTEATTPAQVRLGGRRVLVVEDESLIAMELQADLTRCGWTVVGPAHSLQEGLSAIEAHQPIDVAVLDVNLSGRAVYPLARALQERGTPFVFCTGYEMVDPDGRFPGAPVLRKPVNVDILDQKLEAMVESRQ